MSIQSHADWKGLKRAARVARLTLDSLAKHVRPGVTTGELDDIAAELFAAHDARSAPAHTYGFPRTVLISVNDEIVHGIPGARRIATGDIVKVDVTVEKGGYVADAARTVVVNPASTAAHDLADCAETAFRAALAVDRCPDSFSELLTMRSRRLSSGAKPNTRPVNIETSNVKTRTTGSRVISPERGRLSGFAARRPLSPM